MSARIGVLDVQGAVSEHAVHVREVGATPVLVKRPEDLASVEGLIIPGGESTTIGKLIRQYGLFDPIRRRSQEGMPIFGTCAGLILLAHRVEEQDDPHLDLMNITVNRNSFGRQRESFEADVPIAGMEGGPFPSVFIRAPHIVEAGEGVEVLATYDDRIIAAKQGHLLGTAFHPELTPDLRLHRMFAAIVEERAKS